VRRKRGRENVVTEVEEPRIGREASKGSRHEAAGSIASIGILKCKFSFVSDRKLENGRPNNKNYYRRRKAMALHLHTHGAKLDGRGVKATWLLRL
jgi:hypothetical protein